MKRLGGLWPAITDFDNLLLAYRKARRGKADRPTVTRFGLDLERELLCLQRQLREHSYRPGAYRLFTIYERKPRQIAAAPFRDRVVHHALMNIIEPPLDRRFIHHSYACRRGKGVHQAVDHFQRCARRYPYVLKLDVQRYFPSIDHRLLKAKLRRLIKDRDCLWLLEQIIDGAPPPATPATPFPGDDLLTPLERPVGLPIGNLTSQFFANLYLDRMDHAITERLGCRAYLRYVDDFAVLHDEKGALAALREAIEVLLAAERLRLHPRKRQVMCCRDGVDFLGYRVFPGFRRLRNDNGLRFARRLRGFAAGYARGELDWPDFNPSVQAWIGHARHGETLGLRRRLFGATVFHRGMGR